MACFRVSIKQQLELIKQASRATGRLLHHVEECDACQQLTDDADCESLDDIKFCPDGNSLNLIRREKHWRRNRFVKEV